MNKKTDPEIEDCFGYFVSVTERLANLRALAVSRQARWPEGSMGWRREQAVMDQIDKILGRETESWPNG